MRGIVRALAAFMLIVLAPGVVHAQATLAGLARDSSGGVLPGVTVEATSPVLDRESRTAVTDDTGATPSRSSPWHVYRDFQLDRVPNRRARRRRVERNGSREHQCRAVGWRVQETITVWRNAGRRPAVDDATSRDGSGDRLGYPEFANSFTVGVLIPGVRKGAFTARTLAARSSRRSHRLEANGGRTSDQRMMVNGVALSSGIAGGWGGGAVPNATGTAEFAIDVSGVDAQAATGGVRINFIPRDGGNRFSGTIAANYATGDWASDNFTGTDVQQRGLAVPGTVKANGTSTLALEVRSSATNSGSSCRADRYLPTTTSRAPSST